MLTILLKILSILGIVLLILLGILLAVIIIVLFFPFCYKVKGRKNTEELFLQARIKWLFGLLQMIYSYPDPGSLRLKLLFFTLYDSSAPKKEKTTDPAPKKDTAAEKSSPEKKEAPLPVSEEENTQTASGTPDPGENVSAKQKVDSSAQGLFDKIQYTCKKIYVKIKNILQNISFYKELWQDPDTQGLLRHAMNRIGRIWKSLRPRRLDITATVGTGSPDTTGYLYGLYGILLPHLGRGICITPDFEQAVLEGDFSASGHFNLFHIIFHAVGLLLDKRLRQLHSKISKYQKEHKEKA